MPLNRIRYALATAALCAFTLSATARFTRAETTGSLPIGRLATSGVISIDGVPAPTGTAVFSGDRLSAQDHPGLISFRGGGTVALVPGSSATFSRVGSTLLVQAEGGTIGFHFAGDEEARIDAGSFRFTAGSQGRANAGELTVGSDGHVAMSLSSGKFSAFDTHTGRHFDVTEGWGQAPSSHSGGKGTLVNDTSTFSDPTQRWPENSLRGKCIVARGEAHRIVANKSTTLTISGSWILFSGTYEYKITDCTEEALQDAGAAIGVGEALKPAVAPLPPTGGGSGAKVAIGVAAAGGAAAIVAVVGTGRNSKSP